MKAILVTLFTTGLLQLVNLGGGILAARLLLPAGRGELAAAILWPTTLAYLFLFGLNDAVLYFSAGQRESPRAVFATGLWAGLGLSALAMAAGWLLVLPLAYGDAGPVPYRLAGILMLIIPLHILGIVYQEMLRGHHRLAIWNALRVALGCAYVLFALALLPLGHADVTGFGLAYLAAHLVPLVVALAVCLRAGWGGLALPPRAALRRMLAYGARIHPSNVVGMINGKIDQMLIALYLPPAALGLYVVATTLSQVTGTLGNSVTMVAYPRACAAAPADRAGVIGLYLRLTLALVVASTAVLFILTPYALSLLFGGGFAEATGVVRVMLIAVLPITFKDFSILAFKAYDRSLAISKAEGATLVANAALLALLIPTFGLMGAAWAYVLTRWVSAIYLGRLAWIELGLHPMPLMRPGRADLVLLKDGLRRLVVRQGSRE